MILALRKRRVLVHVLDQVRHHVLYLFSGYHLLDDQHAHLPDLGSDALGQPAAIVGNPLEAGHGDDVRPAL